jgi:Astacin (Peptidase family M12A)
MATEASAYVIDGKRWPGATITYYSSAKEYRSDVDLAANVWNRAAVGATFKRAPKAKASFIVHYSEAPCDGYALVGYQGPAHQSSVRLGRGCDKDLMFVIAVHELGHVLGLGHEKHKCARMNAVVDFDGTPGLCRHHPLSYWVKHPLRSDDIRGARSLYGG